MITDIVEISNNFSLLKVHHIWIKKDNLHTMPTYREAPRAFIFISKDEISQHHLLLAFDIYLFMKNLEYNIQTIRSLPNINIHRILRSRVIRSAFTWINYIILPFLRYHRFLAHPLNSLRTVRFYAWKTEMSLMTVKTNN